MERSGAAVLRAGTLLAGKYRLEHVIGQGGMGVVYVAHHELLEQRVALKLLHRDMLTRADVVARFLNEAKAAARIRSEHVCRVMDLGVLDSGEPFIAMELLVGRSFQAALAGGPLPVDEAADLLLQAIEGVAAVHAQAIVHRDLKPSNLFLATTAPTAAPVVKVLDFGISKLEGPLGPSELTATGVILGSPGYMAPEQVENSSGVDARADIWALGCILYEALTRRAPFVGADTLDTLRRVVAATASRPRDHRPDLPAALDDVVMRCLEGRRERRFADTAALAEALVPFASGDESARLERIRAHVRGRAPGQTQSVAAVVSVPGDADPSTLRIAPRPAEADVTSILSPPAAIASPAPRPADLLHPSSPRRSTARVGVALAAFALLSIALFSWRVLFPGASPVPARATAVAVEPPPAASIAPFAESTAPSPIASASAHAPAVTSPQPAAPVSSAMSKHAATPRRPSAAGSGALDRRQILKDRE